MGDTILVVNAGSSSIKFQVFEITADDRLERLLKGQIDGIGTRPRLRAHSIGGEVLTDETWPADHVRDLPAGLEKLVAFLRGLGRELPIAIGHRVVHGGPFFDKAVVITDEVVERLALLTPLAPLHQPNNIAPIRLVQERQPQMVQVACFDTAFHRGHPEVADRFAIPESLYAAGIRRYGFHGLSYEYIAHRLREVAPQSAKGKVIVAHLGSGASMCAIVDGRSIESTMGLSALDGLPMGTRPGQIDPGVIVYLTLAKKMSMEDVQTFLFNDCGLKGLSGISNDVRDLLASAEPSAKRALDYFVYRISLFAGQLAAAMGGIDAFVFTAGVGENAPTIREAVVRRMAWLGFELDAAANAKARGETLISRPGTTPACYVIPTDEELMIARHTLQALRQAKQRA